MAEFQAGSGPPEWGHSVAITTTDLGHIAAEIGRRKTYQAVRLSDERELKGLGAMTPIPRQEQLCRQRFEELLAYGIVGDYFLEDDVLRGCQALLALAEGASKGRAVDIHVSVCRLGAVGRVSGRHSLSVAIAESLVAAAPDWPVVLNWATSEVIASRYWALNQFAGGVFGSNPAQSSADFGQWAQELAAAV